MATWSRILAWKIPWTEEPGGLQSVGLQRVRHDEVTDYTHAHKENYIYYILKITTFTFYVLFLVQYLMCDRCSINILMGLIS